ncbi:MAG: Hsp33 family molecular chaperone HslO [Oscillospiraceae bacterium]|nr:Hsp33 family molecular chaperone HslO [Oscillospiraceae bacterium]MDY2862180.1 Hsp33 family molecular chaperone HslO [Oscillospiraceae bacterium]MDY4586275.1 Hsp33 family molecular chaperone HslO [Oscillospiraceae bacterium]
MSKMVRAISDMGGVVISAIDSTDIVKRMEEIHKTSAVVSAALGRMLTASQLMASTLKSASDTITLRIKADGPIGLITVACDGRGHCKGYVENNVVEIPLRRDGKLDVGSAVGRNGQLYVVKDIGMKEPYVGSIPLESGEIAEDITAYYAYSEQIPTVCALGVLVNPDLSIKCAGGYLLQLLPGATEEEISLVENNIKNIPSITNFFESGHDVYDIINTVMDGFNPSILDETDVKYQCDCSRERVKKALISIGIKDLEMLRDEEDQIEMGCQYCDAKYYFTKKDLDNIIKSLKK